MIDRAGEGAKAEVAPIEAAANAAITLPLAMVKICGMFYMLGGLRIQNQNERRDRKRAVLVATYVVIISPFTNLYWFIVFHLLH